MASVTIVASFQFAMTGTESRTHRSILTRLPPAGIPSRNTRSLSSPTAHSKYPWEVVAIFASSHGGSLDGLSRRSSDRAVRSISISTPGKSTPANRGSNDSVHSPAFGITAISIAAEIDSIGFFKRSRSATSNSHLQAESIRFAATRLDRRPSPAYPSGTASIRSPFTASPALRT